MTIPAHLGGLCATVMGLGRFGGGAGVTRWLAQQGARVLLTDIDPADRLAAPLSELQDLVSSGSVALRLGGHDPADFTAADLVIANPAVPRPWENPFLRAAREAGVPVTTEIRLLVERLPTAARTIAITGTAGKSTTSAMIHHLCAAAGRTVWFGGNIGGSLLPDLPRIAPGHDVVLELSSAMLYWLSAGVGYPGAPGWSPSIALCTNIAPNHIDWHAAFEHYTASKQQILADQPPGASAVLPRDLEAWLVARPCPGRREVLIDPDADATVPALSVPGRHNRMNAAFAIAAAKCAGIDPEVAARAVATFPGLPHRLELVGLFSALGAPSGTPPCRAINDSKCTTPEACLLALRAMDDEPSLGAARTHLICGGYDKKVDLTPMARAGALCARVYVIGTTAPSLANAVRTAGGRVNECHTLDRAVHQAAASMQPGHVLLLSPGCASWDQFTNYEERGAAFARLATQALGKPAGPAHGSLDHERSKNIPNTG